jgi:glutamate-5-semialdehyde dehydrogenase
MSELLDKAREVKEAAAVLAQLGAGEKNSALYCIAEALRENTDPIIEANSMDTELGRRAGMSASLLDRLTLNEARIMDIAAGVEKVAELHDPIGEVIEEFERPNGMIITKVRVPLGVIGLIYEARPNVTVDSAALSLKAGSGVILRGSDSAINSNKKLVEVIRAALSGTAVPPGCVTLIETGGHGVVDEMMNLTQYLDVLIPRGGAALISRVVNNSRVPVLETGSGNCHVYFHRDADPEMAENIIVNAKVQRPSVCNAAETLLVHRDFLPRVGPALQALKDRGVTIHGDDAIREIFPEALPATEEDYATEYLSLDIAVKTVDSLEGAIEHISGYGTKHTECIVTQDAAAAQKFLNEVDAACVNHNVSTRFTDGFEFGFGAEIGISTQKMHARGPMGLREITSYKYLVRGNGQVRG